MLTESAVLRDPEIPAAGNLDGDRMPRGLEEFLALRITIKNVFQLAAFALVIAAAKVAASMTRAQRVPKKPVATVIHSGDPVCSLR